MIKKYINKISNATIETRDLTISPETPLKIEKELFYSLVFISSVKGEILIDTLPLKFNQSESNTLLFLTPNQIVDYRKVSNLNGTILSFNKEFYCIQYHDSEVSCNGLLFQNNLDVIAVNPNQQYWSFFENNLSTMLSEFDNDSTSKEEMLRSLLKIMLIKANRIFRDKYPKENSIDESIDFMRKFNQLVEANFKSHKRVEDYAQMLNLAPASLSKRLQKIANIVPSEVIKDRIVTEAKRLLIYTDKNVKEIASIIGFDDQHHFSRLFTNEVGVPPTEYKRHYLK